MPAIRKPMIPRSVAIHSPGFGSILTALGTAASSRYGAASPTPTAVKTVTIVVPGWLSAKPTAVPRKGAEHGVAIRVAKTPEKKWPE